MTQTMTKQLDSIVKIITESAGIKEIILFGSWAYGVPTSESDLDLCILITPSEQRIRDILKNIRRNICAVADYPVDLLIFEPDEFESRALVSGSLEHKIRNEGVNLWTNAA